jgi:hypothetical protein
MESAQEQWADLLQAPMVSKYAYKSIDSDMREMKMRVSAHKIADGIIHDVKVSRDSPPYKTLAQRVGERLTNRYVPGKIKKIRTDASPEQAVKIAIKKLNCPNPDNPAAPQTAQFESYMQMFANNAAVHQYEYQKFRPWEHEDKCEMNYDETHKFHYIAYDPTTMHVFGWMTCSEYKSADFMALMKKQGTFDINLHYPHNYVEVEFLSTRGVSNAYRGIGTNMYKRLFQYCTTNKIDYVMFDTTNPVIEGINGAIKIGETENGYKHLYRIINKNFKGRPRA